MNKSEYKGFESYDDNMNNNLIVMKYITDCRVIMLLFIV